MRTARMQTGARYQNVTNTNTLRQLALLKEIPQQIVGIDSR